LVVELFGCLHFGEDKINFNTVIFELSEGYMRVADDSQLLDTLATFKLHLDLVEELVPVEQTVESCHKQVQVGRGGLDTQHS